MTSISNSMPPKPNAPDSLPGLRICAMTAAALCVMVFPGAARADPPGWSPLADPPRLAIQYTAADTSNLIVLCDTEQGRHTYSLGIFSPTQAARPGDWVKGSIRGAKKVTLHIRIRIGADGRTGFTASNSLNRHGDNHAEVYDALAAMLKAKREIKFKSGTYTLVVPSEGFAEAMRPLIAACGDPGKLARQVRARSEPS